MYSPSEIYGLLMNQDPYLLLNCDATSIEFTKGSPKHLNGLMFHCCGKRFTGWIHVLSNDSIDINGFTIANNGKYQSRFLVGPVPHNDLARELDELINGNSMREPV